MDFDIIIVGGGPAGLSAATYALRSGHKVALFEKQFIGGQAAITSDIENYPGFEKINGGELTQKMHEQAKAHGLETVMREVKTLKKIEGGFEVATRKNTYICTSLIIATGASPKKLGIEEGFEGAGVSYCATCDGNFYRNKIVAVIGGGNTALEDAVYLSKIAQKVYLVHRRHEFRASKVMVDRAKNAPNVEVITGAAPVKINGVPYEKAESLVIKNVETGEERTLELDGIFMAVGQDAVSGVAKDLVEVNERGYIVADDHMRTSCEGVFVAGDVRDTVLRQVVTACADGAVAAEKAAEYIASKQ